MTKVIILGGGVAGMSAAHELAERGFAAEVYEARYVLGGKARSIPVEGSGTDGRRDLPGEHGFRFFPRFYRHITDTMKRIPYRDNKQGVYGNLVQGTRLDMARTNRVSVEMPVRFPRSLDDLKAMLKDFYVVHQKELGLNAADVEFYAERLWQMMTSCGQRRHTEYDQYTWWQFTDAAERDVAYQDYLVKAMTGSLAAARAKLASSEVMGDIIIQLMLGMGEPGVSVDRVLNAPTDEAWIKPWTQHLEANGVIFHQDARLVGFNCAKGRVESVALQDSNGGEIQVSGDFYIVAVPVEAMAALIADPRNKGLLDIDPRLAQIGALANDTAWMTGLQFYLPNDIKIVRGHTLYLDSPWEITSISQPQFWKHIDLSKYGDGTIRGIISVIISNWDTEGDFFKEPAKQCTREAIIEEVWREMCASLNVDGQHILPAECPSHYFIDPNLVDQIGNPESRYFNKEPLFINRANAWQLRPSATTSVPNLFLASDYVRTYTQLPTMEAANEAARRAVNAIIEASGANAPTCQLWPLHEPAVLLPLRLYDYYRYKRGLPWQRDSPLPFLIIQALVTTIYAIYWNIRHWLARHFGAW